MSREFPDILDPGKAADGKRSFQGTIPLKWMKQLCPLLAPENDGEVSWNDVSFIAGFRHDQQGAVLIQLEVEAELPLICQRSLQPYVEPVKRRSLLIVIQDVAEQDELPESYEPVLVEEGRLALVDLVEQELLLAVPQVPRNPEVGEINLSTDGRIRSPSEVEKEKTYRPFEGLAGLIKDKTDDS